MNINFNKQKLFEVLITALISASIAFLQSLVTSHFFNVEPVETAATAGAIGALIRAVKIC